MPKDHWAGPRADDAQRAREQAARPREEAFDERMRGGGISSLKSLGEDKHAVPFLELVVPKK